MVGGEYEAGATTMNERSWLICTGRIRGMKWIGSVRDWEGGSGSINIMAAAEGYWSLVFIRSYTTTVTTTFFAYLAAGNG